MTVQEIKEFLRMKGAGNLDDDNAKILHQKTDDWFAELVLLLEGSGSARLHSMSLPRRHLQRVFSYFASEILQQESLEHKEMLFYAALFKDINPVIVEKLSGRNGVEQYLSRLSHKNYFIHTLEKDKYIFFQFQPLFREFLLTEGQKFYTPKQLQTIRRQVATISCNQGGRVEGIEMIFSISDWEEMTKMIKGNATHLLGSERFKSNSCWLEKLPQPYDDDPQLLYIQGMSNMIFYPEQAVSTLKKAYNLFVLAHEEKDMLRTCSGIIDTLLLNLSDLHLVDCWLDILSEKLDPERAVAEDDTDTAALTASMYHGLVLRRPDHPDVETWKELYKSKIKNSSTAALHYLWTGRFAQAKVVLDQQLLSDHARESSLFLSTIYSLRANYFLFTGQYAEGLNTVQRGLECIEKNNIKVWEFHILTHGAGCCIALGKMKKADNFFKQALKIKDQARPLDFCYYHLLKAWQALLVEDKLQAHHHQAIAMNKAGDIGIPFLRAVCCYVSGMVALLLQQYEEAEKQLHCSLSLSRIISNPWTESQSRLGLAYLYMLQGDEQQSHRELSVGFSIVAENGYTSFFFCLPKIMSELCVQALEAEIESEFVKLLIRSKNLIPQKPPLHLPQWPWPLKISTLGRFSVSCNGKKLDISAHAQNKPLMLLQVLVSLGGRQVSEISLVNQLWYDLDGDKQIRVLKTTLHRLRKIIGIKHAILHKNKNLSLNPALCWLDTWLFLRLAGQRDQDPGKKIEESVMVQQAQKATMLYQGIFLPERLDEPWTFALREQLQRRYRQLVICAGYSMESRGQWNRAIRLYQRALERDIFCESFYCSLMRCYHCIGFSGEAVAIYCQCERVLQVTAATPLSSATIKLYQKIRSA